MTRPHLPHVILMKLHAHLINVVILILGTADIAGVLSSSLSLPVGFSIKDVAMDAGRSALQGTHYHADVFYLLP